MELSKKSIAALLLSNNGFFTEYLSTLVNRSIGYDADFGQMDRINTISSFFSVTCKQIHHVSERGH